MSPLRELEDWIQVLVERQLGPATEGRLDVRAEPAPATLTLPQGAQGWLCFADEIWLLDGSWRRVGSTEERPADSWRPELRALLSGELSLSERQSLHLRRSGADLRAWRITEGEGKERVLLLDERFESTEPTRKLRYRVAWRLEPQDPGTGLTIDVWRPFAARFAGWEA